MYEDLGYITMTVIIIFALGKFFEIVGRMLGDRK